MPIEEALSSVVKPEVVTSLFSDETLGTVMTLSKKELNAIIETSNSSERTKKLLMQIYKYNQIR